MKNKYDILDLFILKNPEKEDDLIQRMDGRIEWICKHGIGHTIWCPESMGESGYVHGCDGCCKNIKW